MALFVDIGTITPNQYKDLRYNPVNSNKVEGLFGSLNSMFLPEAKSEIASRNILYLSDYEVRSRITSYSSTLSGGRLINDLQGSIGIAEDRRYDIIFDFATPIDLASTSASDIQVRIVRERRTSPSFVGQTLPDWIRTITDIMRDMVNLHGGQWGAWDTTFVIPPATDERILRPTTTQGSDKVFLPVINNNNWSWNSSETTSLSVISQISITQFKISFDAWQATQPTATFHLRYDIYPNASSYATTPVCDFTQYRAGSMNITINGRQYNSVAMSFSLGSDTNSREFQQNTLLTENTKTGTIDQPEYMANKIIASERYGKQTIQFTYVGDKWLMVGNTFMLDDLQGNLAGKRFAITSVQLKGALITQRVVNAREI